MTIFDDIAYGLKIKKVPKAETKSRVAEMMKRSKWKALEKDIRVSYRVGRSSSSRNVCRKSRTKLLALNLILS